MCCSKRAFVLGELADETAKRKRQLAELLFVLAVAVFITEHRDVQLLLVFHIVVVVVVIVVIRLLNGCAHKLRDNFCLSADMVEAKGDWVIKFISDVVNH